MVKIIDQILKNRKDFIYMKEISPEKRKTAPIISFIMSILLVGTGQMINGQVKKGILMLVISLIINFIFIKFNVQYSEIIKLCIYLYSGYDAYKLTKSLKSGKTVKEFKFF